MELALTTPEERKKILNFYGITEEEVKNSIEIIKNWKVLQPHLPEKLSDDFIGKVLMKNKFRVERTKQKLDNYYSLRGHSRDLIRDFENVVPTEEAMTYLPLPKLTPALERIIIMKLVKPNPDDYDLMGIIKLDLAASELLAKYDDSLAVRYIFDFENFTLKHFFKWNPLVISKHITLIEKAYSCRIMGIHLLNFPEFGSKILGLMKIVMRAKIYERVKVHKDLESLHEVMPKECLPVDYKGTYSSVSELQKKWDQVFKSNREFFIENFENISLEHLRPLESKPSESFGADGTFKTLNID